MLPSELTAADFSHYPPQAKDLAVARLALLHELSLAFVPLLLEQIAEYDWKFPAERDEIDRQLAYLASLSPDALAKAMAGFEAIRLAPKFRHLDWVNHPRRFSEELSAYLWSTHQIDAFTAAATGFMRDVNVSEPQRAPAISRLGIVVIGQGVTANTYPLFRKLRPHGVYFDHVDPSNGLETLLQAVSSRAAAHPADYAHWYVDGGDRNVAGPGVAYISYDGLKAVRTALLGKIHHAIESDIGGPEALRNMLHRMRPEEIGLDAGRGGAALRYFKARVLTDGSGTQIFSTTFVQWSAREALRRAQPVTILAHFTPRQRQRPMNELLSGEDPNPTADPAASLIDADMGAYLTWVDLRRLPGANSSAFLVWFENHTEAIAIGPAMPHGATSPNPVSLGWILQQIVAS